MSEPTPGTDLVVRTGRDQWRVTAGEHLLIGRAEESNVRFEDPRVSRRHLSIRHTGSECLLTDLGSRYGTLVDSEPLRGAGSAQPPFRLHLGGIEGVRVEVDWAPQPQAQASVMHRQGVGASGLVGPGDAVVVGRGAECDIVLDDLLVSRRHVRVVRETTGVFVEDLGSRHGTFVDGERIVRTRLEPQSLLSVGRHSFRLQQGQLRRDDDDGDVTFAADGLSFVLPNGRALLSGISFALPGSSLMAVIGGSGAGKTTLLDALTGDQPATSGHVLYNGRDLYQHLGSLRQRIGVVPQDDVIHPQLTTRRALEYAAELRFPDDLDAGIRSARVGHVAAELGLVEHADTRIETLSGGQRKRVSVALELLTQPSLLLLDEPTSGLDLQLVGDVMELLRRLADGGRTVVVITHSAEGLELCDRVLVLATGGRVAYFGEPAGVLDYFGVSSYREVLDLSKGDPEAVAARFRDSSIHERHVGTPLARARGVVEIESPAQGRQQSQLRQVSTLVRRQVRVLLADRTRAAFLAVLPIALAILALVVPGDHGLAPPPDGAVPGAQATQMLMVLTLGAVFLGLASAIGDLVGERSIYVRERSVGLSPASYVIAKMVVFAGLALVQCTVMVGVTLMFRDVPEEALILGPPTLEMVVALWICSSACVALGLWISATVGRAEQMMPLLVVLVMVQLVLSGGLFPVDGRAVLEQLAWLSPSRWGFAAVAATVGVNAFVPHADDPLWEHRGGAWLGAVTAMVLLGAGFATLAWRRLGRRYQLRRR